MGAGVTDVPHSLEAEATVVSGLLTQPGRIGEVVGTLLEPEHFYSAPYRLLFEQIVAAYYADDPLDPLSIASPVAKPLARAWSLDEPHAVRRVVELHKHVTEGDPIAHAAIVKRDFDYRALLTLSATIAKSVESEREGPDQIAADASQMAMEIATSRLLTQEILDFAEVGRRFITRQRRLMAARAQGIELGAYFGLRFIDNWTRGFQPTELFILAGEPGAGKSAVAWTAGQRFAERQMKKPESDRVAALILSLEMGEEPSSTRVAQAITGIDGAKLREGTTSREELQQVIDEWGNRRDIPLYINHASIIGSTQLRALVVEAIRRHNVGLVIVDHWRYIRMEGKFASRIEEDEEKATFFKQRIAKDLNVACMVLAHTTKGVENREGGRPKLSDLRGSGQIAAEADFVAFVHRPYQHAAQEDIDAQRVRREDAELIWEKNRHGIESPARFFFDPSHMIVK